MIKHPWDGHYCPHPRNMRVCAKNLECNCGLPKPLLAPAHAVLRLRPHRGYEGMHRDFRLKTGRQLRLVKVMDGYRVFDRKEQTVLGVSMYSRTSSTARQDWNQYPLVGPDQFHIDVYDLAWYVIPELSRRGITFSLTAKPTDRLYQTHELEAKGLIARGSVRALARGIV